MTPDIEKRLRDYLDDERAEKVRKADRDTSISHALSSLTGEHQLTNQKLDHLAETVGERFKGVESRISKLEDDIEDTGHHNVANLQAKLKEVRDDKTRYLQAAVGILGAVGTLMLGGAGTVVWYLITRTSK